MMLAILAESALRSLVLGSIVWVGLNLLRVRNPHLQMTCWVMVLVASLSMPLLMDEATVTVTLRPVPAPIAEISRPAPDALPVPLAEPRRSSLPSEVGIQSAVRAEHHDVVNWWTVAAIVYASVAGMLLLRLAVGIHLTWRMARAAKPMGESWVRESWVRESWVREPWAANADVRVSHFIGGPVTFASTILLPPQWIDWDSRKCQAVLAHEGAHVANRDFYVLLLASLNRAVFWFSPFAWWQLMRLAELAEIISDARALEVVEDRLSYAEILLDLVRNVRPVHAGLEMARACTVRARVERILAETTAPAKAGWRKRIWTAAAIIPVVLVSAGSIAYRTPLVSELALDGAAAIVPKPQHVGFYALGPTSIFAIFQESDGMFGQLSGQRKLPLSVAPDGTYSYAAATGRISFVLGEEPRPSELMVHQNDHELRAVRIAGLPRQGLEADGHEIDPRQLDSYVGWYHFAPNRVLTVSRDGDRLLVQETGRSKFELKADGADAFSGNHGLIIIFLRDGEAKVNQLLFHGPGPGARVVPRIDAAKAQAVEAGFARRMAEAPDRFRDQTPVPGSREAVLHGIEDMQRGAPNYDRMSAALAANIRREAPHLQAMFKSLGAVESIFFRGVGPGGYDIYGVKFSNGFAELRVLLAADGKADDVIFRPDGNDAPGGITACSDEQGLRSRDDTTPIRLLFFNGSGRDIHLYRLDSAGKRVSQSAIGDNASSVIWTTVDSPWVVADASGQCLEIVLAGQRTRYLSIEAPPAGEGPARSGSPRSAPLAGSEDMLRQYIEGLSRGEPNYDRMTSEVATQTRRDVDLDRAILARLGALRAFSFRGVTSMGTDVYMAHFANGTAEWRIALAKDGSIGRIALGPQY
jgi:beta-lactamase regulating signal transducer with metallopeptidase domain